MSTLLSTPCYIIVVQDNESSEYYYHKVLPSWQKLGINPIRFIATEPNTLPSWPLNFSKEGCRQKVFDEKGIVKEFTPTEKACWYSHYRLWKKAASRNRRMLILEHDAMVVNPAYIVDKPDYDFWQLGKFMCAYFISPELARWLCYMIEQGEEIITLGPMGFLFDFTRPHRTFVYKHPSGRDWKTRWTVSPGKWVYGVKQAYSYQVKNTIQHWEGTAAEPYAKEFEVLFKYAPELIIDSAPTAANPAA